MAKLTLSPKDITTRDMLDFKKVTGRSIRETDRDQDKEPLTEEELGALIWIAERKQNPETTFEQALDLPISELVFGDEDPNPTKPRSTQTSRASRTTSNSRRKRSGN